MDNEDPEKMTQKQLDGLKHAFNPESEYTEAEWLKWASLFKIPKPKNKRTAGMKEKIVMAWQTFKGMFRTGVFLYPI